MSSSLSGDVVAPPKDRGALLLGICAGVRGVNLLFVGFVLGVPRHQVRAARRLGFAREGNACPLPAPNPFRSRSMCIAAGFESKPSVPKRRDQMLRLLSELGKRRFVGGEHSDRDPDRGPVK